VKQPLIATTALLFLTLVAMKTAANTLKSADSDTVMRLAQSSITLDNIIEQSIKAMVDSKNNDEALCLENFSRPQQQIMNQIILIYNLVDLSAKMQNANDELLVNNTLNTAIDLATKIFTTTKETVNQTIGACSKSSSAVPRGEEIKQYTEKASQSLEAIKKRIH
jgi:hypothetical protein